MEDADFPPTQPSGALVPPTKVPGIAIATATPEPPNRNPRIRTPRVNVFQQLLSRTLDAVDEMADNIAAGLGIRHR